MPFEIKENKSDVIKEYISDNIRSGKLRNRIPSMQNLAKHFNVNVKTALKAVKALEKEGFVYADGAKGTFVNSKKLETQAIAFIGLEFQESSEKMISEISALLRKSNSEYVSYAYLLERDFWKREISISMPSNTIGIIMEGGLTLGLEYVIAHYKQPKVFLYRKYNDYPCIYQDVDSGIKQAMGHLCALGHRSAAYLGPKPKDESWNIDLIKEEAFFKYAAEYDITTNKNWNPPVYYFVEEGEKAAKKILSDKNAPTAFVCVNDEVALGVINACEELGLNVPGDISIIGFDDRKPATIRNPQLTTVKVDYELIAQKGMDLLEKLIWNPETVTEKESRLKIPVQLIVRDSTAPVKKQ
jgi:DNA-binding LacI/PurR family transcriptional regulator